MLLSLVPLKGGLRFCLYFCSCDLLARAGFCIPLNYTKFIVLCDVPRGAPRVRLARISFLIAQNVNFV